MSQGILITEKVRLGTGSVVAVITGSGTVENRYGYDPYGKSTSKTEVVASPIQFDGGYLDTTGLYHFGDGYYSPTAGAWSQPDPPQMTDGGYTFANDQPTGQVDPSGNESIGACAGSVAGAFGAGALAGGSESQRDTRSPRREP